MVPSTVLVRVLLATVAALRAVFIPGQAELMLTEP
jgi:hypothetical protein